MKKCALVAALVMLVAWWAARGTEPIHLTGAGRLYAVTVALDAARPGAVTADVRVEERGAPARTVESVVLSAAMPDMGHVTPEVPARPVEAGRFVARGDLFPMAGVWELAVRVRGTSGTEVITVVVHSRRDRT